MPAVVNSTVGSFSGISEALGDDGVRFLLKEFQKQAAQVVGAFVC